MKTGRVKLKRPNSGTVNTRQLTVPAHLAMQIPDDSIFDAEITDEGLLYRPVYVPENGRAQWLGGTGDPPADTDDEGTPT